MQKFLVVSCLLVGALASCAPRNTAAVAGVTQAPVLIKASPAAAIGGQMTIQGRYLGGPSTSYVLLGADAEGNGGYKVPAEAIVSWTDTDITLKVPANAPVGGSWVYVFVGGIKSSNGLPFSIKQ